MSEKLGHTGRLKVDPTRQLPTEALLPVGARQLAVACLVTDNLYVSQVVSESSSKLDVAKTPEEIQRLEAKFNELVDGQSVHLAIVVKSDPAVQVIDLGQEILDSSDEKYESACMAPESSSREDDIRNGTSYILKHPPLSLVYDLLAGFHPSLDLDIPQTIALYQPYFEALKKRLAHEGNLLIQLDETDPHLNASDAKRMKDHNLGVDIALSNAGFDIRNCRRFLYEISNDGARNGVEGTLLVVEQDDYAEGEIRPHTDTSVKEPDTSDLDVNSVLAAAQRIVTEKVPARR